MADMKNYFTCSTWTTARRELCYHQLQRQNDSSHQWNGYTAQVNSAYTAHSAGHLLTPVAHINVLILEKQPAAVKISNITNS